MSRSVQQNVLSMNAQGGVSASFPGGISIPLPAPPTPPVTRIRWLRNSNGAQVAVIDAYENGLGGSITKIDGVFEQYTDPSTFILPGVYTQTSKQSNPGGYASLRINAGDGVNTTRSVGVLDSNNRSDFLRGGPHQSYTYTAVFNNDGSFNRGCNELSCTRNGIGQYQVFFPQFCSPPALPNPVALPFATGGVTCCCTAASTSSIIMEFRSGTLVDTPFCVSINLTQI